MANNSVGQDFSKIRPVDMLHDTEKVPVYAEHKITRYMSGGDCAYIMRVKYFLSGLVRYEYMVDKEILPEFRKYLEEQGMKTSLRAAAKVPPNRRALRPRTGVPNPGFSFYYNGVVYSQCLVCGPDKFSDSYYICNPNYRLRITFTVPGDKHTKARITDTHVYDWLENNGYIRKYYGTEEYEGTKYPVVNFDAERLLCKGRMAVLYGKKEVLDDISICEERFLYNEMSQGLFWVQQKYSDKLNLLRHNVSLLQDEDQALYNKAAKELQKLEREYSRDIHIAVRKMYMAKHPGVLFVKRFFVNKEDVIHISEAEKSFTYRFPATSTLAGDEITLSLKFLECPQKQGMPWSIALAEDVSHTVLRNGKKTKVMFNKLVEGLHIAGGKNEQSDATV